MKKLRLNADEFATIEVMNNGVLIGEFEILIDGFSLERSQTQSIVNVRINDAKSIGFNPKNTHKVIMNNLTESNKT